MTFYRIQLKMGSDWHTAAGRHNRLPSARRAATLLQSQAAGLNPKTRILRTTQSVVKKNDFK